MSRHQIRTGLGDQGSQVRVLSPRFAVRCTGVKLLSLVCSRFQLAGISHFAGIVVIPWLSSIFMSSIADLLGGQGVDEPVRTSLKFNVTCLEGAQCTVQFEPEGAEVSLSSGELLHVEITGTDDDDLEISFVP